MIKPHNVGNTFLGFLLAAAVARFAVTSKALPVFFNTLVANFFDTFYPLLLRILKKSLTPSACIVLSITVMRFFLFPLEQRAISNLIYLQVFFSNCYITNNVYCSRSMSSTNAITNSFKFF